MPATRVRFSQIRNTTISPTDTGRQVDYAPSGLAGASVLRMNGSGSAVLSGLAGGEDGRDLLLLNASDGLLLLEHESTDSTAANRFALAGPPQFLMPGDSIALIYDGSSSRWRPRNSALSLAAQLGTFDDFYSLTSVWSTVFSGSGTSGVSSTSGVNSTEKAVGAYRINLGVTATARAYLSSFGDSFVPGLGALLHVSRVNVENPPTSGAPYDLNFGVSNGASSSSGPTNGAYWRGYWNSGASEARWARASGTTSDDDTGMGTINSNYIWLITFLNAAASRADYLYSTDSVAFLVSGSRSTSMPTTSDLLRPVVGMYRVSGDTTNRSLSTDLKGFRYDVQRG